MKKDIIDNLDWMEVKTPPSRRLSLSSMDDGRRKSRRHSLIGSATFDMPIFKKRKRKDDDTFSVQSLNITNTKKPRRSFMKVSSLATLFSPSNKTSSNRRCSDSFEPFKIPSSPVAKRSSTPYKAPKPTSANRRLSKTWSDMMQDGGLRFPSLFSNQDIKRQEAIYELYQGENDMLEDLNTVQKTYRDSIRKLKILSEGEIQQIFGPIDSLMPIHEDLINSLQNQRLPDGTTNCIGHVLLKWAPSLKPYIEYCANQVFAKALLDEKRNDPDLDDFLQRCMESPFSRKLDLWSLLDGARSRFMKYPLLLKSIFRYTPADHKDLAYLEDAVMAVEAVIGQADKRAGETKCQFYKCAIVYLYDEQKHPLIEETTSLICCGVLKNNKGTKLHLMLFDKILVVTRPTCQNGRQCYQVYRQPIPIEQLVVEDLKDGEVRMGSFRSNFGKGTTAKNVLRVSFSCPKDGQAHTLLAHDEHDKRQWLQWLNKALVDANVKQCPIVQEEEVPL